MFFYVLNVFYYYFTSSTHIEYIKLGNDCYCHFIVILYQVILGSAVCYCGEVRPQKVLQHAMVRYCFDLHRLFYLYCHKVDLLSRNEFIWEIGTQQRRKI